MNMYTHMYMYMYMYMYMHWYTIGYVDSKQPQREGSWDVIAVTDIVSTHIMRCTALTLVRGL